MLVKKECVFRNPVCVSLPVFTAIISVLIGLGMVGVLFFAWIGVSHELVRDWWSFSFFTKLFFAGAGVLSLWMAIFGLALVLEGVSVLVAIATKTPEVVDVASRLNLDKIWEYMVYICIFTLAVLFADIFSFSSLRQVTLFQVEKFVALVEIYSIPFLLGLFMIAEIFVRLLDRVFNFLITRYKEFCERVCGGNLLDILVRR